MYLLRNGDGYATGLRTPEEEFTKYEYVFSEMALNGKHRPHQNYSDLRNFLYLEVGISASENAPCRGLLAKAIKNFTIAARIRVKKQQVHYWLSMTGGLKPTVARVTKCSHRDRVMLDEENQAFCNGVLDIVSLYHIRGRIFPIELAMLFDGKVLKQVVDSLSESEIEYLASNGASTEIPEAMVSTVYELPGKHFANNAPIPLLD